MRNPKLLRLLAILFSFTLVAAACGGSDDGGENATTDETSADSGSSSGDDDSGSASSSDSDDDAMADDSDDNAMADSDDGDAMAAGDMTRLADDAVFGNGSEAWEHAVHVSTESPLAADGEEVSLFLVNLEGSPGGSFPELREGLQIGIDYINDNLGGVGADIDAGTAGRPMVLDSCPHTLDPAEAQACATESVSADPDIMIKGIDFFSAILWPVWGGNFPVIDTLPIFVSDFSAQGSLGMTGGCVSAFPGAAQMMIEDLGFEKLAVIYSDNAPGQQCWADTQERFYQYYKDTGQLEDFRGFPEAPGDPADNDAIVQEVLSFLGDSKGAVHFGLAAADCAEYNDALDAAGNPHDVFNSGSCVDDATQSAASATGKHFGFTGPPAPENASLLAQFPEFWQWEVNHREDVLIDGDPESPRSTFMRLGFNTAVMAYEALNGYIAAGGDPSDHAGLQAHMGAMANQHRVANLPLDCANKVSDWSAVCDFSSTTFTWNGSEFVAHAGLGHKPDDPSTWTNVQPLLEKVQANVPRVDG